MNIAFIYRSRNIHVLRRASGLIEAGHTVHYIGFKPDENTIDLSVFSKVKFFYIQNIFNKLSIFDLIFSISKIRTYLIDNNIDVLHIQSPIYFLSVLFLSRFPVVIENMGSDVLLIKKSDYLRKILIKRAYSKSKAVIQDSFISKRAGILLGAKDKSNYVIDVGVDTKIFNRKMSKKKAKKLIGLPNDSIIIFSPRASSPNYNLHMIVQSAEIVLEKISKSLYIFASKITDQSLKNEINELESRFPGRVKAVGYLDNTKELPIYMRASDLVVSIPTSDSSPLTVLEAMASGSPVLVSRNVWYRGKFIEGKHINVVELAVSKIAKKIIEVIFDNNSIAENAYIRVSSRYSNLFCTRRVEAVYRKILNA